MTNIIKSVSKYLAVLSFILVSFSVFAAPTLLVGGVVTNDSGGNPVTSISVSVPTPGASSNGDLLLAVIAVDDNVSASFADPLTDWTLIGQDVNTGGGGVKMAAYYRIVDGTEPASYAFSWTGASEEAVGAILRYSGVDTSNPINVSGFAAVNLNQSDPGPYFATVPSVTSTVDDTTVVRLIAVDSDETGSPGVGDLATSRVTQASGTAVTLGASDATQVTAGATGTAQFDASSRERSVVATIVLAPATDFVEVEMVSKTVDIPNPSEGDTVVYTLTLTNNGTLASAATIDDALPGLDTAIVVTDSSGVGTSCDNDVTSPLNCTTASIAAGDTETIIITGTVSAGLGDGTITTNTATLTAINDTDISNDSASADIQTCQAGYLNNIVTVGSNYTYFTDTTPANNNDFECTDVGGTDYGDAPVSFGDASHGVDGDLFIGAATPDAESATQSGASANGDDTDGNDDDDGVTFQSFADGGAAFGIGATITGTNDTGSPAMLCGYLDGASGGTKNNAFETAVSYTLNEVGTTDPVTASGNEEICIRVPETGASATSVTLSGAGTFTAGSANCSNSGGAFNCEMTFWPNFTGGESTTFARFRLTSDPVFFSNSSPSATGFATNGEVEDYSISYNPTAVTIGSVEIESVSTSGLLAGLGVGQMSDEQLLDLLTIWEPEAVDDVVAREDVIDALNEALDPDGDGQVALLIWDTLEERGTIGFYVERKVGDGSWVRINDSMLPGMITAPMGAEYRLADPGAQSGNVYEYQLIEQEATGKTNKYGPYELEMQ